MATSNYGNFGHGEENLSTLLLTLLLFAFLCQGAL
jgi:hypothetical protein